MPAFASQESCPISPNQSLNLVVVCPGKWKRGSVLKDISKVARVIVIVPEHESKGMSSWAKVMIKEGDWIEVKGNYDKTMCENAVYALIDFIEKDPMNNFIHGIMTYDDYAVLATSMIREKLNRTTWYGSYKLAGTPVETISQLQNKKVFREICEEKEINTVKLPSLKITADKSSGKINLNDVLSYVQKNWDEKNWPAVFKPIMGSGKAGTEKVNDIEELEKVLIDVQDHLSNLPPYRRDAGFVLEKYFQGLEVDIDGFARNGKIEFQFVNYNEPANEDDHFLEQGGIYPFHFDPRDEKMKMFENNRQKIINKLEIVTKQIINSFAGYHGVFHFESKIDPVTLDVMGLEFNPRVGGGPCPTGVKITTGYCLPEVAACLALNLPVRKGKKEHEVAVYTHLYPKGKHVDDRCLLANQNSFKLIELVSCNEFGWLTTGGRTTEEAYENLTKARNLIKFV